MFDESYDASDAGGGHQELYFDDDEENEEDEMDAYESEG